MIAQLHIKTALRNGKTYLRKVYHTTPYKIANVTEDKSQTVLHLMLMSSSPGVLDGDEYHVKIETGECASLQLHTQSYQRLFSMKESATQNMEVQMSTGSSFCYIPHPSVPHKASCYISRSRIFLADGCSLTWGEVLTSGRMLSGESFTFSKYHSITEVFQDGRLVVKENLLMQPSIVDVNAIGQLEGFTHQATLMFINDHMHVDKAVARLHEWLSQHDGVCFGVSALQVNGLMVRVLGYKAELLHALLKQVAELINSEIKAVDAPTANAKEETHAS